MNAEKEKQLILSLIKDDLINSKLVNGLNSIGLDAGNYYLHLSETIFDLMGLEEKGEATELYEEYLTLAKKAAGIDLSNSDKPLDELALAIYLHLKVNKRGNRK